jgi:hypothetical protein
MRQDLARAVARALLAVGLVGCAATGGATRPAARVEAPRPGPVPAERGVAVASPPAPIEPPQAPAAPRPELPRGGREIFPAHRLVGFCGTPGAPALGPLHANLPVKARKLEAQSAPYAGDRKILPVFELIAVVVQGAAGPDGKWRHRVDASVVDKFLELARGERALLLLNIQPGHSDFVTEVKHFEKYLREPDVGVALDPEWAMKPGQKPGVYYGQTTGAVLDQVATYLSSIVKDNDLPEKALVFHQVNHYILKNEAELKAHPGVVAIKSVDGLGPKGMKLATYASLMRTMQPGVHPGFKLFYDEDTRNGSRLMTPPEVLALTPVPEYVMYE